MVSGVPWFDCFRPLVADVDGRDFSNQDLRRSNFTSASCKRTNFKGAKLEGAYFIKAVVPWVSAPLADCSVLLCWEANWAGGGGQFCTVSRPSYVLPRRERCISPHQRSFPTTIAPV